MSELAADDPASVLAVDDLAMAIRNSIDKGGMESDAAREMALHVLHFFGFNDRIIDNVLEPEDRDAFYMLEDSGLLVTEREETSLYDGREWRIHFWMFRRDKIERLVRDARERAETAQDDTLSVYAGVPDDVWARMGAEPTEAGAEEESPPPEK